MVESRSLITPMMVKFSTSTLRHWLWKYVERFSIHTCKLNRPRCLLAHSSNKSIYSMPDVLKKWYDYFLTTAFSITHYTFLNRLAPWAFTPWALPPFCPSMKGYERPPTILMIPSVCLWNRVINMYKSSYTYLHILFWVSFKKRRVGSFHLPRRWKEFHVWHQVAPAPEVHRYFATSPSPEIALYLGWDAM